MRKLLISIYILAISAVLLNAADLYDQRLKQGIKAINEGKFSEAGRIFKELLQEEPQRPESYCGLAILNMSTGNFEDCHKYLITAIEKNKKYSQGYYLLGMVEERLKNYSAALKNYRIYLSLEPDTKQKEKILKKIEFLEEKINKK